MLAHLKTLSMWEIAHYWHGCDPRESTSHHQPLSVRNTLLVLCHAFRDSLSIRVEHQHAYVLEIINKVPRYTARHYRQAFKRAITQKRFSRLFFESILISRTLLAQWCTRENEPLPLFWFPDNQQYPYDLNADANEEMSDGGRYKVQILYDDRKQPVINTTVKQRGIVVTVNENAVKAAQASHAPINAIKERFFIFYMNQSAQHPSKKSAAESFYATLDEKQEQLLFMHKDAAIRTLLDGLREHLKQNKPH